MSRHLSPTKRCICLVRLILLIVERSVQSDDVGVGINSRIFWMENEQNLMNNSFHYKLYRPQVICSAVIFQHAIWIFHCFQISTWPTCAEILWSTAFKEMHFILEYPGALAAVIWVYRLFYLAFHTSGNCLDRKKKFSYKCWRVLVTKTLNRWFLSFNKMSISREFCEVMQAAYHFEIKNRRRYKNRFC